MTGEPAFDHRDDGTSETSWAPLLQGVARVTASERPLVVLAAHPDDETLGAGGLIAASERAGAAVTVLVASDGEASHPLSPTHTPARLAELRRDEVTAAVARLAPNATVRWLGLPDGRLADYPGALDAALRTFVTSADVRVVAPYRADGHPDHEACARSAARVAQATQAELWEYPIWFWHWGDPLGDDLPRSRCRLLALSDADRAAKQAALAEHRTQHTALSERPGDEPVLTPAVLSHFDRPFECFVAAPAASRGAYFDALYAGSDDPWGLDERFYERRKREVLLATLPRWRFRRTFEPGCATGALTARLAERTDELVAWDLADAARETARRRLEAHDNVSVEAGRIPEQWPSGHFELIVLSEVGYYCEDLDFLARRVRESLTDDGVVLACHWRRDAADHPHRAEQVHTAVGAGLATLVHHVEDDFVLDVWSRVARSVAETDGIA